MNRVPVESSNIKSIGHDPAANVLHVEFHGPAGKPTRVYEYPNVSAEEHQNLLDAASLGSHFHRFIRGRPMTRIK